MRGLRYRHFVSADSLPRESVCGGRTAEGEGLVCALRVCVDEGMMTGGWGILGGSLKG
jgi:hypothetical protein